MADMKPVFDDLCLFTQYRAETGYSDHQYLLLSADPCLIHAGTMEAARENLEEIERILDGRALKYILVSHIEADESGGLPLLCERWRDAKVICSEDAARQIPGFGISAQTVPVSGGQELTGEDYAFSFLDYPSEAHLRSGILAYERVRGIFFSSDLMARAGEDAGKVDHSDWHDEVNATGNRQIPSRTLLRPLRHALLALNPKFIAVGHGFCLKLD